MPSVFANGRSILHAGDGLKHTAAPPDVCKTPSPGGPVPIPYVNIASDSDLTKGTKKTFIEGKSAAIEGANLSTSTGDEPGTAGGGIVSSKTKGKMTWGTASSDVKFEGKGVIRFMDVTQHNGNSFNSAFTSLGGTGLAYGDDFQGHCVICGKSPGKHRVLETPSVAKLCSDLIKALKERFRGLSTDAERKKYARLNKDGSWGGYMVGAMVCCHDPGQSFVTHSGATRPGFAEVAGTIKDSLGATPKVIEGGAATLAEFQSANRNLRQTQELKNEAINAAFALTEKRNQMKVPGYNPPGNCAGAKLVAKSGHAALHMSEAFFAPGGRWSAKYNVLTTSNVSLEGLSERAAKAVLANKLADEVRTEFTSEEGDTGVASCHTCQRIIYLTQCPPRTC